jgi:hypothetical protein
MSQQSGIIRLDGDIIRYRSSRFGNWDLPLREVRVIGEATDQSGPFLDDYRLCFAVDATGWYEASFYADGCEAFLAAASERLRFAFELSLCASTDFASRVLWPPQLTGQPMFQYTDEPPRTWLGRLVVTVLGDAFRKRQTYADAAKAFLVTPEDHVASSNPC